jgi:hypothetical protein
MTVESANQVHFEDFNEGDQNTQSIECLRCSCCILRAQTATFTRDSNAVSLPPIRKGHQEEAQAPYQWTVNDMMTFENIGFSKADPDTPQLRYLVCAECELGPLGYQKDISVKEFVIAGDRVSYKP